MPWKHLKKPYIINGFLTTISCHNLYVIFLFLLFLYLLYLPLHPVRLPCVRISIFISSLQENLTPRGGEYNYLYFAPDKSAVVRWIVSWAWMTVCIVHALLVLSSWYFYTFEQNRLLFSESLYLVPCRLVGWMKWKWICDSCWSTREDNVLCSLSTIEFEFGTPLTFRLQSRVMNLE